MAITERSGLNVPYAMTRTDRVPARRYHDPEFFAMENELLWPRVWQMACRLEDIPEPGDWTEYEILDQSVIVVRVDESTVKAYGNACRHRGVKLVEGCGSAPSGFTCPFHGWCWGTDGDNTFLYQPDLFDDANRMPDDLRLQEVRVETWGGCAFVNFDDDAPPLRDSIEPFASIHDARMDEDLRAEWWLSCVMPTNWKLAMEAFMEGYHVMQTHPQLLPPGHKGRVGAVYRPLDAKLGAGVASRQAKYAALAKLAAADPQAFVDQTIRAMRTISEGMAGMTHVNDLRVAETMRGFRPSDPEQAGQEWFRELNDRVVAWHRSRGERMPDLNELAAQGLTSATNYCFPNFFLLPTYSSASSYRIRPLTPETCLFEVWSLTRYPPGEEPAPPPRPAPMPPEDPRWPPILRQDFSNLPRQQKGLHARGFEYMRLSTLVEGTIGNYHRLIDGYLAGLGYDQLLPAAHLVSGPIEAPVRDLGF